MTSIKFPLAETATAGPPCEKAQPTIKRFGAQEGLAFLALRALGRAGVSALGDTRRFAAAAAEIIELGAAHRAAAHDLDRIDDRRIEREDALDALAEANLADREVGVHTLVGAGDAHAL